MQYAKPNFPVHLSTIRCVTPLQVHCIQLASIMLIRRFHPNMYIYIYIYKHYINDSDLFKFLLIYSLFLSYFAELKFPVKCTDDSWAVGSEVIVVIFQRHNKCNPFLFSSKYCSFNNVLLTQCIHRSIIQLTMIRIWLFGRNVQMPVSWAVRTVVTMIQSFK